ncbi:MAG: hypothetical protein RLZZ94_1057 [Bacteroidota bacterium]|jgi:hypothetical protein
MIEIGKTLISTELLEEHFVCDLNKCKGECCIAGDYGAPLDKSELKEIEKYYPIVKPLLQERALKSLEEQGLYMKDDEGDWVTPLINGNEECAFTIFENGIAKCSFEKAYYDGQIPWKKPISCHLYPVRIKKLKNYDALNYDRWDVCAPACKLGKSLKVPVYQFLKESLTRKYGEEWYKELTLAAEMWKEEKGK